MGGSLHGSCWQCVFTSLFHLSGYDPLLSLEVESMTAMEWIAEMSQK